MGCSFIMIHPVYVLPLNISNPDCDYFNWAGPDHINAPNRCVLKKFNSGIFNLDKFEVTIDYLNSVSGLKDCKMPEGGKLAFFKYVRATKLTRLRPFVCSLRLEIEFCLLKGKAIPWKWETCVLNLVSWLFLIALGQVQIQTLFNLSNVFPLSSINSFFISASPLLPKSEWLIRSSGVRDGKK